MQINPLIFRAYDIRGIVDQTLTEDAVYNIGRAIGTKVLAANGANIVIGRDGRLSGLRLSKQLAAGLMATGCNVVDIGIVPTPCLYFAAVELGIDSAIMLTGSHNPPDYNGLKIIIDGTTIYGNAIQELYALIIKQEFTSGVGQYSVTDISDKYIQTVIEKLQVKKPLKIVVDCGNGVPGILVPILYEKLGCQVIPL